jgi:hypothetical protein
LHSAIPEREAHLFAPTTVFAHWHTFLKRPKALKQLFDRFQDAKYCYQTSSTIFSAETDVIWASNWFCIMNMKM